MTTTYLVYKPFGMVCQFSGEGSTLKDLHPFPKDVYPVGRLDKDSEGLLLISNDPNLHHRLTDPKFRHSKTYLVQVEGQITPEAVTQLEKGVQIALPDKQRYTTKPCKVRIISTPENLPPRNPPVRFRKSVPDSWIDITLTEGKNRQVRKMTAAVGFPTLRLIRVAIGQLKMNDLQPGDVRKLEPEECLSCFQ